MSDAPKQDAVVLLPALPSPRPGGFLRTLVVTGVAAGVTLGWVHTTRIERWLRQLDGLTDTYDGYKRHRILGWLDAACAPDDVRAAEAFALEVVRGAEAITPPLTRTYDATSALDVATPALARRQPAQTERYLHAVLTLYARLEDERCVELIKALGADAHAKLREVSATIEDPTARYGALLLVCAAGAGRPEDADAIFAGVEAESPPPTEAELIAQASAQEAGEQSPSAIDSEFAASERHKAAQRALLGFGDAVVARLVTGFQSRSRAVANLCARVLRQTSLATLIGETEKRIDQYAESGNLRPLAQNVVARAEYFRQHPEALEGREPGAANPVPSEEELTRARAILGQDHHLSNLIAEALQALLDVRGDERVDLSFMRALSSPNEAVAKFCARELRARLTRAQFADALFKFLTQKGSFWVREVEVYEGALKGYGPAVSVDIVRNLESLLEGAKGKAGDVFWIHKAIALRCLAEVGAPDAYGILVKYADDPGGYVFKATERGTGKTTEEQVFYNDLARKAAGAIAGRSATSAPTLPPRPALETPGGEGKGD